MLLPGHAAAQSFNMDLGHSGEPGATGRLVQITALFTVHVFVNIAMTIGLVPITGIPLPFISYGGTFVLSCCLLQGLVQSVYRFRKDFA